MRSILAALVLLIAGTSPIHSEELSFVVETVRGRETANAGTDGAAQSQPRDNPDPARNGSVPTVASLNELEPRTIDQELRAKYFDRLPYGPPLRAENQIVLQPTEALPPAPPGEAPTFDPADAPRNRVCPRDAIVIGRATAGAPYLTASRTSLFSDFQVEVDGWIKPMSRSEKNITASTVGGRAIVSGRSVEVRGTAAMPTLQELAIFFLDQIPQTDSFEIIERFPVRGNAVSLGFIEGAETDQVLSALGAIAAACS